MRLEGYEHHTMSRIFRIVPSVSWLLLQGTHDQDLPPNGSWTLTSQPLFVVAGSPPPVSCGLSHREGEAPVLALLPHSTVKLLLDWLGHPIPFCSFLPPKRLPDAILGFPHSTELFLDMEPVVLPPKELSELLLALEGPEAAVNQASFLAEVVSPIFQKSSPPKNSNTTCVRTHSLPTIQIYSCTVCYMPTKYRDICLNFHT